MVIQVREDREVVVLRRAQAVDEDDGQAVGRSTVRVGIGVVDLVVVDGDGRHGVSSGMCFQWIVKGERWEC